MKFRAEGHAVVVGAGPAGLFAARALADAFGRVTVVERDDPADGHRRGVPQSGHAHDFLIRGHQIAEQWFPGIGEEMVAGGAHAGDIGRDLRWVIAGRPLVKGESGLSTVVSSRGFRERHLRARVEALPQVTVVGGQDVAGLSFSEDGSVVDGVLLGSDGGRKLSADLVVDASGRGSRTPVWLEEHGHGRVEEEKLKVDVGYATRIVRAPADAFAGDVGINVVASPDSPRGGACQRVEDDRVVVTLYGVLGDHPPTDAEGFNSFAKSLAAPDIYRILEVAEPLSEARRYRFPASLRRHYERMGSFPRGLLVLGDAVCSLNPRYGQGMAFSAMQALALHDHLREEGEAPQPDAYFRRLAEQAVDPVWGMTLLSDLSFPGVQGERTPETLQVLELVGRTQVAATLDGSLALSCLRVFGLLDPPTALLDPAVQARVHETLSRQPA
ncbi:FAD-dependent oxidoreductase [Streptomyces mayonensis]|uniref:FAD-dependent oxidoreductase n=1 Tax=Streptomyces mayonensis TaxID=2750816 RepID=UPI001C1E5FC2|nr:FAD-dependent monooxygenase [Streptomyces sp. A108]MBU6534710.1 FAD-binding protein [Streptomyces sp. A108]